MTRRKFDVTYVMLDLQTDTYSIKPGCLMVTFGFSTVPMSPLNSMMTDFQKINSISSQCVPCCYHLISRFDRFVKDCDLSLEAALCHLNVTTAHYRSLISY